MRFGVLVSLNPIHAETALKKCDSTINGIAATGMLDVTQETWSNEVRVEV